MASSHPGVLLELDAEVPSHILPACIKERLHTRQRPLVTLESIQRRLAQAAQKRRVRARPRADPKGYPKTMHRTSGFKRMNAYGYLLQSASHLAWHPVSSFGGQACANRKRRDLCSSGAQRRQLPALIDACSTTIETVATRHVFLVVQLSQPSGFVMLVLSRGWNLAVCARQRLRLWPYGAVVGAKQSVLFCAVHRRRRSGSRHRGHAAAPCPRGLTRSARRAWPATCRFDA